MEEAVRATARVGRAGSRLVDGLALAIVFAAAFAVHSDNLDRAILGMDSYATILASRVRDAGDLGGTFSEVMMDGRLAGGDFYRPVGNAFIALDYAVWGLDPFGYQLTSLVLWSLSAALLFALARRSLGGRAWVGPIVGASFYVLHPAVLSVLSVPARRTEILQALFILAALLPMAGRASRDAPGRRALWAGLFAALAIGAKESGVIAIPLIFVQAWAASGRGVVRERVERALRASAPAIVLVGLVVVARFAVIGGLGGYRESSPMTFAERLVAFGPTYLANLTSTGGGLSPARRLAMLGISSLALGVWAVAVGRAAARDATRASGGAGALAAIGVAWLGAQLLLACGSFQFSPRYGLGMVAGASLALAALAETAARAARGGSPATRRIAAATGLVLALVLACALRGSPLWYDYPAFARASEIETRELEELAVQLAENPPERRRAIAVRKLVEVSDPAVDHVWVLSPWSLQAWIEMTFPELRLRVEENTDVPRTQEEWNLVLLPERVE